VDWGPDAVGATIEALNARIEDGVCDLDVVVPPRALRGPHMLGIRLAGGAPRDLAARLAAAGVFVSVRGDAVRVSPHVYNVPADVDRLLELLAEAVPGTG
jgi:selenocysteine lyase/cysteine desulfurase